MIALSTTCPSWPMRSKTPAVTTGPSSTTAVVRGLTSAAAGLSMPCSAKSRAADCLSPASPVRSKPSVLRVPLRAAPPPQQVPQRLQQLLPHAVHTLDPCRVQRRPPRGDLGLGGGGGSV